MYCSRTRSELSPKILQIGPVSTRVRCDCSLKIVVIVRLKLDRSALFMSTPVSLHPAPNCLPTQSKHFSWALTGLRGQYPKTTRIHNYFEVFPQYYMFLPYRQCAERASTLITHSIIKNKKEN